MWWGKGARDREYGEGRRWGNSEKRYFKGKGELAVEEGGCGMGMGEKRRKKKRGGKR